MNLIQLPCATPFKIDVSFTAVFLALGRYAKERKILEKIKNLNIVCKILFIILFLIIYIPNTLSNGYVNICDCIFSNKVMYIFNSMLGITVLLLVLSILKKSKLTFNNVLYFLQQ